MKVLVYNQQRDLSISKRSVKPIVEAILSLYKRSTDEVAVYFVSTKRISSLHNDFFDDPTTTDCISFPFDQDEHSPTLPHMLGEVFICPKTAQTYVSSKRKKDVYWETTLYLVHGLLHLMGYDDTTPALRRQMKTQEARCMKHLGTLLLSPDK